MEFKVKILVLVLVLGSFLGGAMVIEACPMHLFTPDKIADILMQPTYDEIATMKADLVNGVITYEQWEAQMYGLKVRLGVQRVILEAIRDSGRAYEDKLELLNAVFPWNIRGGIAH
jgi:hypothetical protein